MTINQISQNAQSGCLNIFKVTVDGQDLANLKRLVPLVMVGGDAPDDGLAEIFQKLKKDASARGKNADNLAGMTYATKLWMDKNPALYGQLAQFKLQPRVQECHELTKGTPICDMTTAATPASPDLYLNMFKLLDEVGNPAHEKSLSYYVYDKARPACPYFGMHRGMLTFALQDKCQ